MMSQLFRYDGAGPYDDSADLIDSPVRQSVLDHLREMFVPTLAESNEYSASVVKYSVALLGELCLFVVNNKGCKS